MKKILFVLLTCAMLLPVLLLPAAAVQIECFDFPLSPNVLLYDVTSDFPSSGGLEFYGDYLLPSGQYQILLIEKFDNNVVVNYDFGLFDVSFDSFDDGFDILSTWNSDMIEHPALGPFDFNIITCVAISSEFPHDPYTKITFNFMVSNPELNPDISYLRFVPVGDSVDDESSNAFLSSLISTDSLSSLFDELISLLPILIPALISFVGIRKAIIWLISFLSDS